jgi:hypothetical protein
MKLLMMENSHLTVLFQIARNKGQLFLPEAALMLASRYNFSIYPKAYEEMSPDKVEFKHGKFEDTAIESLQIYSDGIVVSANSDTDIIESFFSEFCEWLKESLGLSFIKTHYIDKIYDSTLVFQTDKNILKPLEALGEIADTVQSILKDNSGLDVRFEPFGWVLSADSTLNPALKPISLRIERRAGIEFSLQHYISAAPLKTKQHLALLEKLESLV